MPEHNARAQLAQQELSKAVGDLLKRSDIAEIMPIIKAFKDAVLVEMYGLWLTSVIESEGDIVKAWELVDNKISEKRNNFLNSGDTDTTA